MRNASNEWKSDRLENVRAQGDAIADLYLVAAEHQIYDYFLNGFTGTLPLTPTESGGLTWDEVVSIPSFSVDYGAAKEANAFTVVWSDDESLYATEYEVAFYYQGNRIAYLDVENDSRITTVDVFTSNPWDKVEISVLGWSDQSTAITVQGFYLGAVVRFNAENSVNLEVTERVSLNAFALPQNSLRLTAITPSDSSPVEKTGVFEYIRNGATVKLTYGKNLSGGWQYINGGTFYLSSWEENDGESVFECLSSFAMMQKTKFSTDGRVRGLDEVVESAFSQTGISGSVSGIRTISVVTSTLTDYDCADIILLAANASRGTYIMDDDGNAVFRSTYNISHDAVYTVGTESTIPPVRTTAAPTAKNITVNGDFYTDSGTGDQDVNIDNKFLEVDDELYGKYVASEACAWIRNNMAYNLAKSCSYIGDCLLQPLDHISLTEANGRASTVWVTETQTVFDGAFSFFFSGVVIN